MYTSPSQCCDLIWLGSVKDFSHSLYKFICASVLFVWKIVSLESYYLGLNAPKSPLPSWARSGAHLTDYSDGLLDRFHSSIDGNVGQKILS